MSKNPIVNALIALTYIVFIALIMTFGTKSMPGPDTFLAPIVVICLFTLSAAVMGYIFCYQPIQLYFDNKKKEAVRLFMQTVFVFGILTGLSMVLLFTGTFTY